MSKQDTATPQPRAGFFGWAVLLAVGYSLFVGAGFIFYAMSVLLQTIVAATGFSVAQVSAGNTIFLIAAGLAGIGVGELIARYDVRWTVCFGTLVVIVAYYLLPHADTLHDIYLLYILLGIGYAMTALVPSTTVVARWFVRRRALALALTQSGLSLGGILLTPILAAALAAKGLDGLTSPVVMVALLLNIPLAAMLMRPDPRPLGQWPDGDKQPEEVPDEDGVALGVAVKTRFFRYFVFASVLALMAQVGTIAHIYNWALERAGPGMAAAAIALMAFTSLTGRLVCGAWLHRFDLFGFVIGLYLAQALALAGLALVSGTFGVALMTLCFGLTVGNILMCQPLLLGAAFGLRDFARLLSYQQLLMHIGVALGPIVIGLIYDFAGGYRNAFFAVALAAVLAAFALARAGRPQVVMAALADKDAARGGGAAS